MRILLYNAIILYMCDHDRGINGNVCRVPRYSIL